MSNNSKNTQAKNSNKNQILSKLMTIIEEQLAENNLTVNSHFEKDLEIKITEKIIKFDGIFSSVIEIDVPLKFY